MECLYTYIHAQWKKYAQQYHISCTHGNSPNDMIFGGGDLQDFVLTSKILNIDLWDYSFSHPGQILRKYGTVWNEQFGLNNY